MPPLKLEGETLGQRHHNFNKLVKDAVANNKHLELTPINYDDNDIENLLKIDVASKNKNVDYIIEVLKCEDILYVSRAIKQSTWLITESQYTHIINPKYLETQLFPYMKTKAINKLLLHVKLNLKEETRVEEFYNYIQENKPKEASKWLQNCSIDFVENVLTKESRFPLYLFKRLCKRSFHFIKYCGNVNFATVTALESILFLLSSHTEEFLDYLDTLQDYIIPTMGKKPTEIIMNKCPHRILDKFEKYASSIHLPTVAKYIKKEEIKNFVLKYIKNDELKYLFKNQDNMKHFVKRMPENERFEFVKKIFIEKTEALTTSRDEIRMLCCSARADWTGSSENSYRWYQYAPFNIAIADLKKLIRTESSPSERCAMIIVLLNACGRNPLHLQTVLQYYYDKHMNEAFKFKIHFVNNVLSLKPAHEFDEKCWNILNQLFHSLEVYAESSNNAQSCLKPIILYNVLHDQEIPVIVEKKFAFDTFKNVKCKLNKEQKNKIFTYLLNHISTELENDNFTNHSQFREHVTLLTSALNLLMDWNKDIQDFPFLLQKLKNLVTIKKENSFKTNLSSFYNLNKSWRRHMFEESLELCASKETCLNVLKHQPSLLVCHSTDLYKLHINNAVDMCSLLAKLRIYYPNTLAQQWKDNYFARLHESTGHKALLKGLFTLLPQKEVVEIAKKYAPEESKINWSEVDQTQLSIRKNVAMNLYLGRPSTPLDILLLYAKGDYLQYIVPSLNAVLYDLSKTQSRECVPKLLEAPVSLQKYGIHLAFDKLTSEELRPMFLDIWKTTKNSTIRTALFVHIHSTLCKLKDAAEAKQVWNLMSIFIDNLSFDENKLIYNKMGKVKNVHLSVRAEYYMKSFLFLKSLPAKTNSESILNDLIKSAPLLMEELEPEFVTDNMLANFSEQFCNKKDISVDVISSFLLHANSEKEQMRRFEKTLGPLLDSVFKFWDTVTDNEYLVKNNYINLTKALGWRFRTLSLKKKIKIAPVRLFAAIKSKIEDNIPKQESYLLYTYWKLTETYARLVDEHRSILDEVDLDTIKDLDFTNEWISSDTDKVWCEVHNRLAPALGAIFVQYLREDVVKYFPSIYLVFAEALSSFFSNILNRDSMMESVTLRHMLEDKDCIPSYLVVCQLLQKYGTQDSSVVRSKIRNVLSEHPSMEVQLHYSKGFWDYPNENKHEPI